MPDPLADKRQYTICNPMNQQPLKSDRGDLAVSNNGYLTTQDAALAKSIKEIQPWAIVTEHEPLTGGRAVRGQSMITVPALPWVTEKEKRDAAKRRQQQSDDQREHTETD